MATLIGILEQSQWASYESETAGGHRRCHADRGALAGVLAPFPLRGSGSISY